LIMTDTAMGLREWARGMYATEAAVELLLRSFGGRFADAGQPWIRYRPGGVWLDVDAMIDTTDSLSGGEQRVLRVVEALAYGRPVPDLPGVLAGVDRDNLTLILAAFSHASGSHEHNVARRDGDTLQMYQLGPVLAWPDGVA
jgi:hypothetical protein